ncbi:AAA family ATPase [Bacteroides cellulosilyticus]|uniref:AAA family ATPase n=1 Tax=Bacteroides cellulosilyticus TaxID=246787 RepID=UPI0035614842
MWKLSEITAENICSFNNLHYVLNQGVTTLVFGNNMDNDSQGSNGSGKSALIECIATGITGSPLRKVKNEEIINDSADECMIRLEFFNDTSDEVFVILRRILRKGGSMVECLIKREGKLITTDEAVRPGVDAYNKYILEKLGITKDELYNNFLLSRHKYQDFLSSSDKDKKEIINRFSNASLVDIAVDKVSEDKKPVDEALHKAELKVAGLNGRIEMLAEQIQKEEDSTREKARTKDQKLADMEKSIGEKRALIRDCKEETEILKASYTEIEKADKQMQVLEDSESSVGECLEIITGLLAPLQCGSLSDWNGIVTDKKVKIEKLSGELSLWDTALEETKKKLHEATRKRDSFQEKYRVFSENMKVKVSGYDEELKRLDMQITGLNDQITGLGKQKATLTAAIENLNNKLAGTITCPVCRHQFLLSDENFDVEAARRQMKEKETEKGKLENLLAECRKQSGSIEESEKKIHAGKRDLTGQNVTWEEKIQEAEKSRRAVVGLQEEACQSKERVIRSINSIQTELDGIRRKLFDEAFSLLDDAYKSIRRNIGSCGEDIKAAENAIGILENTMKELKESSGSDILVSLEASLKEYRKQSSEAVIEKEKLEKQANELMRQADVFLQFKSFLANTKIAALAKVTNEFLESIGSDIRLHLSGFTSLKSGKVREKISVSLLRSGMDCGSFDKFSEGEKCRVNLATILAMQKLVNGNCEEDKGLNLIVLDEILSPVDEDGLASMFGVLNQSGITTLVISHGNISESYPYKLIIHKKNGQSYINNLN